MQTLFLENVPFGQAFKFINTIAFVIIIKKLAKRWTILVDLKKKN